LVKILGWLAFFSLFAERFLLCVGVDGWLGHAMFAAKHASQSAEARERIRRSNTAMSRHIGKLNNSLISSE
jgi:hypothetical protein